MTTPSPRRPSDSRLAALLLSLEEERQDRRRLTWALGLALAAHAGLFVAPLPDPAPAAASTARPPRAYVLQQHRFKPPERPPERQPAREPVRVPVPDLTPDDPEPIRSLEPIVAPRRGAPEYAIDFEIPVAPPPPEADGPFRVGGRVTAPVRISGPDPTYTEMARRAREQGVVVLRTIVDREGRVLEVEVLRGLRFGLTESAVAALKQWRFRPGTLGGEPVDVVYDLHVRFQLQ